MGSQFRDWLNENMLDGIRDKFEDFIDKLPKKYTYKISINGLEVLKDKNTIANIPKKESHEIKKWLEIIKEIDSKEKTPLLKSELDKELKAR